MSIMEDAMQSQIEGGLRQEEIDFEEEEREKELDLIKYHFLKINVQPNFEPSLQVFQQEALTHFIKMLNQQEKINYIETLTEIFDTSLKVNQQKYDKDNKAVVDPKKQWENDLKRWHKIDKCLKQYCFETDASKDMMKDINIVIKKFI